MRRFYVFLAIFILFSCLIGVADVQGFEPLITVLGYDLTRTSFNRMFQVQIQFRDPDANIPVSVDDFTDQDISLTGSAFASSQLIGSSGSAYICTIIPTGSGSLTITVLANSVHDINDVNSGNDAGSVSYTIDLEAPTVSLSNVPTTTPTGPFDVTVTFSEDVIGFDTSSIDVTGEATATAVSGSGKDYTVTITPEADKQGNVTLQVPADAVADAATNGNTASSTETVFADLAAPTVTFSGFEESLPQVNSVFDLTITFSENVTGFTADDINIGTNEMAATVVLTGSGAAYTATFTPVVDGLMFVQIPADAVTDAIGHGNEESPKQLFRLDRVAPTVTFPNWPTTPQNSAFDVRIAFSEDVGGFVARDDLTLTGPAMAALKTAGSVAVIVTITPNAGANGTVTLQVPADAVADGATNGNTASSTQTVQVDLVSPSVSITDVPDSLSSSPLVDPFDVTIGFSEAVTGFQVDDISISVEVSDPEMDLDEDFTLEYTLMGSGTTYTLTVSVVGGPAIVTIEVPPDGAEDAAGNLNTVSNEEEIFVDSTYVGLEITGVPTDPQNRPFDLTFTFTESVIGFDENALTLGGSATATLGVQGSGADYTVTVTPDTDTDGVLSITLPPNTVEDSDENGNTNTVVAYVDLDTVVPTVSFTNVPSGTQNDVFDVTVTFSEDVTGFQVEDIDMGGTASATVTSLTEDVEGREYTVEITPSDGSEGNVTIQVMADAVDDKATNRNAASSETVSVDLKSPTVSLSNVPTTPQKSAFDVTVTFSENVTGFEAGDISLAGASATATLSGSGTAYTATITPGAGANGSVTISVGADVAEDAVGNGNTASSTETVSVDLVRPSVSITGVPTTPQNGAFDATITFSESVTGFEAGDISLGGVSATATLSGSGTAYTATITPGAGANGSVTISVGADVAEDAVGNGNTASSTKTVSVDLVRPSVSITGVPTTSQNGAFDATITFSEDVTGFEAAEISLSGAASVDATVTIMGSGAIYTASITPTISGSLTIDVPANVATDNAGNANTAASTTKTVTLDLTGPTVSITNLPDTPKNSAFTITITFNEVVTGFVSGDISLGGTAIAEVTDLTEVVTQREYTAEITPTGSGNLTIQVPANVVQDAVMNPNTASTSHTISIDLVRPTVTITDAPTTPQNGAFPITITFNEVVTGFQVNEISLTGTGTARAMATLVGIGDSYTATITPTGSGILTIAVPENVAEDAATNGNTASTTHTISIDLVRPTVTITDAPTTPQNGAFPITITFNEVVTGFQVNEISLTGTGTARATATLVGIGDSYTATITPTGSGILTIAVPENVAEDAATNGNTASTTHTVPVDVDRPSVTITNLPTTPQNGVFGATITFSESVTGFEAGDISLGGVSATATLSGSGTAYTATITPGAGANGSVTISVGADVAEDAVGNGNTASSTETVSVDLVRPSVSITGVPTTPQNGAFDATITFSESVTGFEAGDISLGGVSATATLSGSGTAYTATITPGAGANGSVTISVGADVAEDAVGNGNTASSTETVSVDLVRPSVSITGVPTTPQNGAFDATITFSESVTGFEAGEISLGGVSATATLSGSGTAYTATITPGAGANGSVTISVGANVAEDAVGNGNTASSTKTVSVDLVRPSVSITGVPTTPQNGAFDATITFSENVTGFGTSDIMVTGEATATAFLGSGADYTVTITPNANKESDVTLQVKANAVMDVVLNNNTASAVTSPVHIDTIVPTVAISGVPTGEQKGAFDVTITFSEDVRGFQAGDLTVTGDAARSLKSGIDGDDTYVVTITPGVNKEGNVTLQVPASVVTDLAGNHNTASTVTSPVHIDTIVPTVTISGLPTGEKNGAFDVTITFSEDVMGFQVSDLGNLVYAAASLKSGIDGDDIYVVTITPNPGEEGDVTIEVPANVVTDDAMNNNTASQVHTVRIDTAVPTVVAISGLPPGEKNGPFDVTVTFSEDVTGFGTSGIMVTGEAEATAVSGSGKDYEVTITPNANKESDVTLQVKVNAAQDLAGNNNTASSVTSPVHIDTIVPTVAISGLPTGDQKSAFDVTITFSEDVMGFVVDDDVTHTGPAAIVLKSGIDGDDIYVVTITPNPGEEGDVTIEVPADVVTDLAGNNNTASSVTPPVHIDTDVPTVAISGLPTGEQNGPFDVTITFSEDVNGFVVADDITRTGPAAIALKSGSDGDSVYMVTITPNADAEGNVTLQVKANTVTDDALNYNTASSQSQVYVDTIVPTVESIAAPNGTQNGAFNAIITFSEDVTGFEAAEISLSGAASVDATVTIMGSGAVYTASITPTISGSLTIDVPANVATDNAGNANTAASTTKTVTLDLTGPTVSITNLPDTPKNSAFTITITFNEVVTGFVLGDISLGGTAIAEVTSLTQVVTQKEYTAEITPTRSGNLTIQVPANVVQDAVTNPNTASTSHTVSIDLVRPTVTITGAPTTPQNGAFPITIEFSETVTGFGTSGIMVTGEAEATAVSGSGKDYEVTITPNANKESDVTLQVKVNAAQDLAGNNNTASTVTSPVHIDTIVPTVTISEPPPGEQNGPFDVTVTFSEDVMGFVVDDDVTHTGPAAIDLKSGIDGDDIYVVTITPDENEESDVTLQVKVNAAQDLAGNNNTASTVTSPVHIDTIVPTVTITVAPTTPQNGAFPITIEFSEAVTGFQVNEISLTGTGTATATATLAGIGDSYTARITPTGSGILTIAVPENVAEDAATNGNTASITRTVPVDVDRPTVTLSNVPTVPQNGAFTITITFNEVVTGFVWSDISLGGTAIKTVVLNGSGTSYTATITPEEAAVGNVEFHVPENVAEDGVGNGNTASQSETVPVDRVRPTTTITGVPEQPQTDAFVLTITFSKNVDGFDATDISLTGSATASVVTVIGGSAVYSATITPTGSVEGDIIIQVSADVATDALGNGNAASPEHTVAVSAAWMPDKNLRDVVREVLGLPQNTIFSKEALLDLTLLNTAEIILDVEDPKITDLTGLEYATELIELYLNENAISDLRPLAALRQLTTLTLNDNAIEYLLSEDLEGEIIDPFIDLTELTTLSLDGNLIADISPLEILTQLTTLSLNGNLIADISRLEILTQLTTLSLNGNLIADISRLKVLTQLTTLSLNDNSIDDISFCAALTQLKVLCLENNEISDVSSLAGLENLEVLKLNRNPIGDTTPLIGIARHIEADVPIASLISDEALEGTLRVTFDLDTEERITYADMRSLTQLEAPDSDITVLSGLDSATQLGRLDLRGNSIEDLTALKGLTKLTILDLGVNNISNINALSELTELVELYLEENRITDITSLLGLVNLEVLRLVGNPIADARPLAALADVDVDIDVTMYLVSVPDAGLASVLREALGLEASAGIPSTELKELTSLNASNRQIGNLRGLELATGLTTLDLRNNAITDVTPLAALISLETLRLTGNPIQDASSLAALPADIEADIVVPGVIADPALATVILDSLGLPASTRIKAVTLQNLKDLDVEVDEIETLTGLERATNLTTLIINGGSIADLTPLQTLTQLTTLAINSGAITDLTPLETLTELTMLAINSGAIIDLTPLQTLTQLTTLAINSGVIADLTPLEALTQLITLAINGGSIVDLTPLETLTQLTVLELRDNAITDITPLSELVTLKTLDLSGNSISDIVPRQEATGTIALELAGIAPLQGLTDLTTLDLSGNSISDIDVLQGLAKLEVLDLSKCSISSIDSLQGLTRLTTLNLSDNSISDIDALQGLTRLTTLNLSTNDLNDIQPLQGLTALRQLFLTSNNISDVSSLAGLVNLELLRLAENPILDTSPLFPLVTTHKLTDVDVEIARWAPWDVNQDGIVDTTDSTLVTGAIGQTGDAIVDPRTDVNGDGTVDGSDLLLVTEHLGTDNMGAPSKNTIVALLGSSTLKSLDYATLEAELNRLIAESDGSLKYQYAIAFLKNFLLALRPNKTRLLANYPNPFNPETWIPYHLANAGDVQLIIYSVRGTIVRRLDLGHQQAGYYVRKNRAAYWNGRNAVGERVASGIYFYELRAGSISALRKMVILK